MTDYAFRTQHLTHAILGYSQNPSNDTDAPQFVGSIAAANANKYVTIEGIRPPNGEKRDLKRKRKTRGDLEVVDGDNAYVGPWAGWEGENAVPEGLDEDGVEEEAEESQDPEDAKRIAESRKKTQAKRSTFGQETSIFHGKSLIDYQGRTYMHPPLAVAPHLTSEPGQQECFIPKACVHTFTGHTQGVSVIRTFPKTGHLMISGSMDTKIKASRLYVPIIRNQANHSPALGRISRRKLSSDLHGSSQSCKRHHIFQRR